MPPGESLGLEWIGAMAAFSMSSLYWEHRVWRHGMEAPGCPPPVFAAVQG
jgi:hypothetical protein